MIIDNKKEELLEQYNKIPYGTLIRYDRGGHHIYKGKNDLITTNNKLIIDWDWNNQRMHWQYTASSHDKINWICHICNKSWLATIDSRNRGTGCPHCSKNTSMPELVLCEYLKANEINFQHQYKLGKFTGDIVFNNTLIEYNGSAFHNELINNKKLIEAKERGIDKFVIISEIADNKDCIEIHNMNNNIHNIQYHCSRNNSLSNFSNLVIVLDNLCNNRLHIHTKNILNIDEFIESAYKNKGKAHNSILNFSDKIMSEYCYEYNPSPDTVYAGSTKKLKWRCNKCKSIYECSPLNKKRGDMCPVCSHRKFVSGINDLQTQYPDIASEIVGVNPKLIFCNSTEKVTWRCKYCFNTWESRVKDRTVLDASCKVCGYTLLTKDRTLLYSFNSISTKYNIEYFKYKDTIIDNITCEKQLLTYIISEMLNTKYRSILIDNKYIDNNNNVNKEFVVSRFKAKQKISKLFEIIGLDVNDIKIKPEELFYGDF